MSADQPLEILLLGFTLPEKDIQRILAEDPAMPTQTHRFAWAVVGALQKAGCQVRLLSLAPVVDYPANPRVWYGSGEFLEHGAYGRRAPFVNLLGLKHFTRLVSAALLGLNPKATGERPVVVVHGINTALLGAALVLKAIRRLPIVCLLTDPPNSRQPGESAVVGGLRRIDHRVLRALLRRFDGVIALTLALADDLAPGVPYLLMEGIAEPHGSEEPRTWVREVELPTVIYAGGLSEDYGVTALIDAVETHDAPVRLVLYGRGQVEASRASSERVRFGGLLDPQEVGDRLILEADFLINPRPVDREFVKHTFPSKMLQYLGLGIPTISTRLPSFPSDYEEYVIWADEDGPEGLASALTSAATMDANDRRRFGQDAREFILSTRGVGVQGRRMVRFLRSLDRMPAAAGTGAGPS